MDAGSGPTELGGGVALLSILHPGGRKAAQIEIDHLQDLRILPKTVNQAVVVLHHSSRYGEILGVEGTFVGEKETDLDLLLAHDDPPMRLSSGKEKRKARTIMMAELTHHWHQAWMTYASR
jgi:hypothetical protein